MSARLVENVKLLRRALAEAGIENMEDDTGSFWVRHVRVQIDLPDEIVVVVEDGARWTYEVVHETFTHDSPPDRIETPLGLLDDHLDVVALIRRRLILAEGGEGSPEMDWLRAGVRPELRKERA